MADRTTQDGKRDPAGAAKDRFEAQLAKEFGGALAAEFARLLEVLNVDQLQMPPEAFWEDEAAKILAWLRPRMQDAAEAGAEVLLDAAPFFGVRWDLVNERAADWAATYSFDLVSQITSTQRRRLQRAISNFVQTPGATLDDLVRPLESLFGPRKAEEIAVTEITRAFRHGQEMVTAELAGQGIAMREVWQTNNDELVCPVCGPRHATDRATGGWFEGPPAHPRCRCWISHEWDDGNG